MICPYCLQKINNSDLDFTPIAACAKCVITFAADTHKCVCPECGESDEVVLWGVCKHCGGEQKIPYTALGYCPLSV